MISGGSKELAHDIAVHVAFAKPQFLTRDEVPEDVRATTGLQSVTMPLPRGAEVPATLASEDLVRTLREWWGKTDVWVVRDGERGIVGVVQLSNVLEALK